ncbi:MAG: HIT family protein [Halobacteriovoraceae bacterium]|nr:HIT family protein [Halobacteriovoraceae bacterium]
MFTLDERLESEFVLIGQTEVCEVLVKKNSEVPWVVLVPKVENVSEYYELHHGVQFILLDEINFFSKFMKNKFEADKINIAMFGNIVPQLHVHIVARFKTDRFWPGNIIGHELEEEHDKSEKIISGIKEVLASKDSFVVHQT